MTLRRGWLDRMLLSLTVTFQAGFGQIRVIKPACYGLAMYPTLWSYRCVFKITVDSYWTYTTDYFNNYLSLISMT